MTKKISGTQEWAKYNENIQRGCENDCKYCYAKAMAVRFGRSTPDDWKLPVLSDDKLNSRIRKRSGTIMFPTTHDITKLNIVECIKYLRMLLSTGQKVLVVSKPSLTCVRQICDELEEYKKQVLFRFTIGSAQDDVLSFWEPGAPTFSERLAALELAYANGYQTGISGEPMLDNRIEDVVSAVRPFVTDSIWIGKANQMRQRTSMNCPNDSQVRGKVDELIAWQNDNRIIEIYQTFKDDPLVKWKESIKKVVGLDMPAEVGLDI